MFRISLFECFSVILIWTCCTCYRIALSITGSCCICGYRQRIIATCNTSYISAIRAGSTPLPFIGIAFRKCYSPMNSSIRCCAVKMTAQAFSARCTPRIFHSRGCVFRRRRRIRAVPRSGILGISNCKCMNQNMSQICNRFLR